MKLKSKISALLVVLAVVMLSFNSCSKKVCPAYASNSQVEMEQNG